MDSVLLKCYGDDISALFLKVAPSHVLVRTRCQALARNTLKCAHARTHKHACVSFPPLHSLTWHSRDRSLHGGISAALLSRPIIHKQTKTSTPCYPESQFALLACLDTGRVKCQDTFTFTEAASPFISMHSRNHITSLKGQHINAEPPTHRYFLLHSENSRANTHTFVE